MTATSNDSVNTDVLIVGGGTSGLATAIHLADLITAHNKKVEAGEIKAENLPLSIVVIEKGSSIGSHSLSGAVVNPRAFKKLLPDVPADQYPIESPVTKSELFFLTKRQALFAPFHPPYMGNKGNSVASVGKIARWLAGIAGQKGVQIFSGFAAQEILWNNGVVAGVKTGDSGVDKDGNKKLNYQAGTKVNAKVTVLAEGPRGSLTKELTAKLGLAADKNPQVYSTGIKELWRVPEGVFEKGRVVHTMGYPLGFGQFGGGFIYGLGNNLVALGLVIGLDYHDPTFDPHNAFQIYKTHPFVKKILKDGKLLRYGAKTIPEGGLFSMPRAYDHGVMMVGDGAGFVSMPALKGIHLGIESGMLAAQTIFEALKKNDFSKDQLSLYDTLFKTSAPFKELKPVRNFRQGFKRNLFFGMIHFGLQLFTGGRGLSLSGKLKMEEDGECRQKLTEIQGRSFVEKFKKDLVFDKTLTFDKVTDVFFSGTQHDEHQPCHLIVPDIEVCRKYCIPVYGGPCQHFCPAEVYEIFTDHKTGKKDLRLHPTNCVHCKTCDIKDPFKNINWVPPYGGDGPEYENL